MRDVTLGRRGWLGVALLLSLGINIGLLAADFGGWWAAHRATAVDAGDSVVGEELVADGHGDLGWVPGEVSIAPEPATGDSDHPPYHRSHLPPLDRMADHLELEGEVRERFVSLQREFLTGMAASRIRRQRLTLVLYGELAAPQPDRQRVDELLAELAELHAATERLTADSILDSRALLDDPEQRRYLEILKRLHGHGEGGGLHGRRGRGRRGGLAGRGEPAGRGGSHRHP